jgi:hypothetical protein
MRVALVSCVKAKRSTASPARHLYTSQLFRALRSHAEATADRWYILSAEHGLVRPDQVLAPYERTLNRMPKHERVAWADAVWADLLKVLPADAEVVFLAGARYREGLENRLREHGFAVSVPLKGLGIGKQLQRLKEMREEREHDR